MFWEFRHSSFLNFTEFKLTLWLVLLILEVDLPHANWFPQLQKQCNFQQMYSLDIIILLISADAVTLKFQEGRGYMVMVDLADRLRL